MLPRTERISSEEFIFYIDIITGFLKKKSVIKAISSFIKEKEKFSSLSSYGVVLFQKSENPINVYGLKNAETVVNTINDAWETREKEQSYLENGLYEILAYIFRSSREAKKNYRVIIISDTPSKLSEDYYNALYDLLIKAKKFSAFIDIIRVGDKKFYEDDVKLKIISSECMGGMFYCQDEKLLQNILSSLLQNKKEFKVLRTEASQILPEDKVFYERLAVDLISLSPDDEEICTICEQELCPICEAHSDEIHKCFNCDAKFHSCCASKYSIVKNIGFKHIYRCPQCETLLKIDEEYVKMIYEEELGEKLPEIDTPISIVNEPEEEVVDEEIADEIGEEFIEEVDVEEKVLEEIPIPTDSPPDNSTKKVKVGGFFGKEIEIKIKKDAPIAQKTQQTPIKPKPSVSITTLKPPRKKRTASIKLCKICGATLQNTQNCPTCGAKVD